MWLSRISVSYVAVACVDDILTISYYEGYSEKSYFSPAASTSSNGSWFLVYFKRSDQDPTFKTFHPPTVETCLLLWAVAFLVCLFVFDDGPRIHRLTRAVQLPFGRCVMYSFCRRVDLTHEPYETDSDSNGVMVSKCVLVHWPSCAHRPFHQVPLLQLSVKVEHSLKSNTLEVWGCVQANF